MLCCSAGAAHAASHGRRHQRAAGVPLLPAHLLLLLLAEAALPGQARAVGHSIRVRVLPPEVPHQELADDAQEPAAPRLLGHAEAAAEDDGAALGAAAAAAPPVRPGRAPAAAARPAMTRHPLSARHPVQEEEYAKAMRSAPAASRFNVL